MRVWLLIFLLAFPALAEDVLLTAPEIADPFSGRLVGSRLQYKIGRRWDERTLSDAELALVRHLWNADADKLYRETRATGGYSGAFVVANSDERVTIHLNERSVRVSCNFRGWRWTGNAFVEYVRPVAMKTDEKLVEFDPKELLKSRAILEFGSSTGRIAATTRSLLKEARAGIVPTHHLKNPPVQGGEVILKQYPVPIGALVLDVSDRVYEEALALDPLLLGSPSYSSFERLLRGRPPDTEKSLVNPHDPEAALKGRVILQGAPASADVRRKLLELRGHCQRYMQITI